MNDLYDSISREIREDRENELVQGFDDLAEIIKNELRQAARYPSFHSAHEGYAVLLEEVDELKEQVWKNNRERDYSKMMEESIQVIAMGYRFLIDIALKHGGEAARATRDDRLPGDTHEEK